MQAEDRETLQAWLTLTPEARWYAAENGLVRLPWQALEAAEQAGEETREARESQASSEEAEDSSADDGRGSEGSGCRD